MVPLMKLTTGGLKFIEAVPLICVMLTYDRSVYLYRVYLRKHIACYGYFIANNLLRFAETADYFVMTSTLASVVIASVCSHFLVVTILEICVKA